MNTTELPDKFEEQRVKLEKTKSQLAASQVELAEMQSIIAEKDRQIDKLRAQIAADAELGESDVSFVNISKDKSIEENLCAVLVATKMVSPALAEPLKKLLITLLPILTEWAATEQRRNWLTSTQRTNEYYLN